MEQKINFGQIWKRDSRIRLLTGGMIADGLLLAALIIVGVIIAL